MYQNLVPAFGAHMHHCMPIEEEEEFYKLRPAHIGTCLDTFVILTDGCCIVPCDNLELPTCSQHSQYRTWAAKNMYHCKNKPKADCFIAIVVSMVPRQFTKPA